MTLASGLSQTNKQNDIEIHFFFLLEYASSQWINTSSITYIMWISLAATGFEFDDFYILMIIYLSLLFTSLMASQIHYQVKSILIHLFEI